MSNIHNVSAFGFLALMFSQISTAQTVPTINGSLSAGNYTVTGVGQKATPGSYPTVAIYICSSTIKPAAKPAVPASCNNPPATPKSAALTNPAVPASPTGDYVLADSNGNFAATLSSGLSAGQYVYITQVATPAAGPPSNTVSATEVAVGPITHQCNEKWATEPYKDCDAPISLIGGAEQSAQSSSSSETTPFLRVFTRASPKNPFYLWGLVRLLGAPTTSSTQGVVSVVTDPSGNLTTQTFSTIGTSIDYTVGGEYAFHKDKTNSYSISIIAGFGGTTPLQANNLALAFQAPSFGTVECTQLFNRPGFASQFSQDKIVLGSATNTTPSSGSTATPSCLVNTNNPTTTGSGTTYSPITTIGFSNQDRTSFLGKEVIGIRTIDRFLGSGNVACGDSDTTNQIGPCERGIVDWTFGQDASITGGQMRNWIFKVDAVHPLPVASVNFLYLFGSASLRLSRNVNYAPLILQSAPISTLTGTGSGAIPNPSVVVLSLVQPNRDFYRFGVGINVNQIFTKLFAAASATK